MHLPGSIIDDRYQIIQKLGRSERERTYLAKDLQATSNGKCVVKQLSFDRENEANWQIIRQYLLNEVAVLQRIGDHPQIPQLYDHFVLEQRFYLVREYIDGDNLEQEVEQKQFDEAKIICLIQDGLRILDFIHKTNVIHRDIQPIHLVHRQHDNTYVLIDFGAMREIEATEINLQGELIRNHPVGNWVYSAPEQKTGESNFSSDIYSLAKSAVYALTGKSPQELEQTKIDWRSQCQISPKLKVILEKMMFPVADLRYCSALEVLQDLRPLLKIQQLVGGRYSIISYLGGKAGLETYLADNLHRQYQSPCIIKQFELPHSDGASKIKLESRFAEELSILERLGYHDQIPQLWDHFAENDEFYLVQEHIKGENLAQKIAQQNLSTPQIVQIVDSTLSVLQFVHQNRLIHRNIKPSNLIVRDSDQQVIITDFGILQELKTAPLLAADSRNFDRENYWSPEQIAGRPTISSDLYAVGMTAIEALTGNKPDSFTREQTGKLLWSANLNLDRRLIRIIDKLIRLDLGQRYQSADKVLSDLRKVNSYGTSNQSQPKLQIQDVPHKQRKSKSTIPLLIGLLGIISLLGSIEFAFPRLRPFYYSSQGEKLLSSQQPQDALDAFSKAIDLKPESWRGWLGRGDALAARERYDQALAAYREATELSPNNSESWKKQGDILLRLENFGGAIAAYNQALELEPEDAMIHNQKGRALFELQQYEAALVMQDAAWSRERDNPQFLSDRAHSLLKLGRYSQALEVFNRVQAIEPNKPELWQDKFLVLEALNRPQAAAKVVQEINNSYLQAVQQQPGEASGWIAQANFFTLAQMYDKAADSYSQAVALKPDSYEAWLGQGNAFAQAGDREAALEALDRALQIRPQSYRAWQAKGQIYQERGNYSQAIANYNQAIKISADDAALWRDQGIVLAKQKNYAQAIKSLTKASELSVYSVQTWQELAQAKAAIGQDSLAVSTIERGLKYYSKSADLWSLKGLIETRNGDYNAACATYRQARKMGAESPSILSSMRQLGCRRN
ncbi:MAG: tetratricopeptide repeat protein [Cyanobacteria bacterium J06621_12]